MTTSPGPACVAPWTVSHDFMFMAGGAEVSTLVLANNVLCGAPVRYLGGTREVVDQLGFLGAVSPLTSRALVTHRTHRALAPLYPQLLARVTPIEGNLMASSYAYAHHVPCTGKKIVYCHSPMRQIWSSYSTYSGVDRPLPGRIGLNVFRDYLRRADVQAAHSADLYIATSNTVAARLADYYGIGGAPVVAPPVDSTVFHFDPSMQRREDYLWVGRITEPYKRLSLVLEAFRELPQQRLMVVGDGPDRKALERTAPRNVTFVGWQEPTTVARLYHQCRGVIFPSEDDFGLVPVEAMSCGASLIAMNAGGPAETTIPEVTGVLFDRPDVASLKSAIARHALIDWQREIIAKHAIRYGVDTFSERMRELIAATC